MALPSSVVDGISVVVGEGQRFWSTASPLTRLSLLNRGMSLDLGRRNSGAKELLVGGI